MNKDRNNPLYRGSIYDCTSKYGPIADDKFYAATHILGCYKGKVIKVIRIESRYIESSGEFAEWKVFEGEEQPDSPYMNMDLHEVFNTLANFRVKYWNL